MTTAREAEATKASVAFQIALTKIGVETVAELLKLWQHVPADVKPAQAAAWLNDAVALVLTRRQYSRDLARSYYRLVRALRTGKTTRDWRHPEPKTITLHDLRREFAALAEEYEPSAEGNRDDIEIVDLPRQKEDEAAQEAAAEREARIDLAALGPERLNKMVQRIDTSKPAEVVDKLREKEHAASGSRQAATGARIAKDGGRSEIWASTAKDSEAIGYIRLSRTGTPCGWCAMLISRGPVYKSQASASLAIYGDGDLYHDNCNCYAEPVFSREQYDDSDIYELNRTYSELWPQVTKGLSGKAALSAWRRFITTQNKAAQEAAATTTAQEA